MNFSQLEKAANKMVPGVEVWVQAQQQPNGMTDIPPAAVALCRTDVGLSKG
jgi:hypothetical protein